MFRGDYSKKDTPVYAVKVKSKLGAMVEKSFLYYDFIFQFAKIVKPVLGSIGYLDSKVIKQLQASADFCVQNDTPGNENNPVIVLEGQGAVDELLNGAIANNVIDRYGLSDSDALIRIVADEFLLGVVDDAQPKEDRLGIDFIRANMRTDSDYLASEDFIGKVTEDDCEYESFYAEDDEDDFDSEDFPF